MIAILELSTNKYFDLDDKASLSFNHKNNYFDLDSFTSGDGVVSFNIPDTDNNNLLFKNYKSVAKSDLFEELDVAVFLNGNFQYKGKLGINKFAAGYDCYLLIGKSSLHQTLAKKIADIGIDNYNLLSHKPTVGTQTTVIDYTAYAVYGRWRGISHNASNVHFRFVAYNLETNEILFHEFTLYGSQNLDTVCANFNNWLSLQTGWITEADFVFLNNYESTCRQLLVVARGTANIEHTLFSNTHTNNEIPFSITSMELPTDIDTATDLKAFYEAQQLALSVRAWAITDKKNMPFAFPPVAAENFIGNEKWLGTINMVKGWKVTAPDTSNPTKIPMMQYNSYWDGCTRQFCIVPFFSLKWLIEKTFDFIESETGFVFDKEILNDQVTDTYLFNTKALDRFFEANSGFVDDAVAISDFYSPEIITAHHIPNNYELSKIVTLVRKITCSSVKIDYATQKITFVKFNDVASNQNIPTLTNITTSLEFDDDNFSDYYLSFKDESSDDIFQNVKVDQNNVQVQLIDNNNNKPINFIPEMVGRSYDLTFNRYKLYRYISGYRFSLQSNNQPNNYTISATKTNEYFVGYMHDEHYYPKNKTKKIEIPCSFLPYSFNSNFYLRVDANNGRVVNNDAKVFLPETAKVGQFAHIENNSSEPDQQHFTLLRLGTKYIGDYFRRYVGFFSFTYTAEDIYNEYYKTFFDTIKGRKVQLSAMLTKQQYEEILKNDFFIFQNRRLIFTEMDVNFENINVLNNRFEAKITAYIC
jgi:hypothetical protein